MSVCFPVEAVLAIYTKENGRGMIFSEEEQEVQSNEKSVSNSKPEKKKEKKKGPHLKVVK